MNSEIRTTLPPVGIKGVCHHCPASPALSSFVILFYCFLRCVPQAGFKFILSLTRTLNPWPLQASTSLVFVTATCCYTWPGGTAGRTQGFERGRQAFWQVSYIPNSYWMETEAQVAQADLSLRIYLWVNLHSLSPCCCLPSILELC